MMIISELHHPYSINVYIDSRALRIKSHHIPCGEPSEKLHRGLYVVHQVDLDVV
jgi:hypothetical protein